MPFAVTVYRPGEWASLAGPVAAADVILLPGDTAAAFPQWAAVDAALVIDGYDPVIAEWLAVHAHLPPDEQARLWRARLAQQSAAVSPGRFLYLCQ